MALLRNLNFAPSREEIMNKNNSNLNKAIAASIERSVSRSQNRLQKILTSFVVLFGLLFLLEIFRVFYEIIVCSPRG